MESYQEGPEQLLRDRLVVQRDRVLFVEEAISQPDTPNVQRKTITVAVTTLGGTADKEIISFLSADSESTLIRTSASKRTSDLSLIESPPDLLVVDIGSGSKPSLRETLGELLQAPSSILVIAPDERFAAEAYRLRVSGYVTKPVEPQAFSRALEWAKTQVRWKAFEEQSENSTEGTASGGQRRALPERLMVKSRNHIHLIRIDDIDWIEANAGYSWIHTQGKKYLLRGKMKCLEESLPDDRFVRIHRSLIVNVDRIRELQQISRGEYHAILGDGTTLAVSRNYRGKLFSAFVKAS